MKNNVVGGGGREVCQNSRDDNKDDNVCPNALFSWNNPMRLAADIIGGQPTTILRDGMPDKLNHVNPGIYKCIWRNHEH